MKVHLANASAWRSQGYSRVCSLPRAETELLCFKIRFLGKSFLGSIRASTPFTGDKNMNFNQCTLISDTDHPVPLLHNQKARYFLMQYLQRPHQDATLRMPVPGRGAPVTATAAFNFSHAQLLPLQHERTGMGKHWHLSTSKLLTP